MSKLKIIFGLGNPGEDYKNTYHNAGSLLTKFAADRISSEKGWQTAKKEGFKFLKENNLVLMKSLGFMNESGQAAKAGNQ